MAAERLLSEPEPIPIDLYFKLSSGYEREPEYVDGAIVERSMGDWDHSAWQLAIQRWFLIHADEWRVRIRPELHIRVAGRRVRVADVAILDRSQRKERVPTHPPIAVFEILSPDEPMQELLRKLEDYAAMGVPQIWVVDPPRATFRRYLKGELLLEERFEESAKGISFKLDEISQLVD